MPLPVLSPSSKSRLLEQLPREHLLRDLIAEHEQLLQRLDDLEALVEQLRTAPADWIPAIAFRVRTIADYLLRAEPHHQREEEVLFPAMERLGVMMPCLVMRHEHEQLRALKRDLLDVASRPAADRDALAVPAATLVAELRAHIRKENEVLYPMAFSSITAAPEWERMRAEAAKFGACCTACACKSGG